jgi:hypothetical protein
LYNSTLYERRKPYVKEEKTEKYKYPIAHSINKKGIIFSYTDEKKSIPEAVFCAIYWDLIIN